MDFTLILLLVAAALAATHYITRQGQRKRILLLAQYLGRYQIEPLMQQLLQGYPRAAGEAAPGRSRQVFSMLDDAEQRLSRQFAQFVQDFAQVPREQALLNTSVFPNGKNVDMRQLLQLHAQGIQAAATAPVPPVSQSVSPQPTSAPAAQAADSPVGDSPDAPSSTTPPLAGETLQQRKQRAYTMSAELLLMQHSCHWFCRSHRLASMRLIMAHRTPLEQVLASVSPATRSRYQQITGI